MDFTPADPELQEDPFPVYRWLRDDAPVYYNKDHDFWALSRFDDVLAAMGDYETFSSAQGVQLETASEDMGLVGEQLLSMDPPRHRRMRDLVSRAFTPRRISELEPQVRDLCRDLLEPMMSCGGGDLVGDFAARLPMTVISLLVGIPPEDRDDVRHLTDRLLHRDPGVIAVPPDAEKAGIELYRLMAGLVASRRAEPAGDMITALLAAEISDEGGIHRLADHEVVMFLMLLAIAGYETTTKLIAGLGVALERFPEERAVLVEDLGLVPGAVEEALRWDGPSHYFLRVTTGQVELHDQVILPGERVLLVAGAANRDDRQFDDPDAFRVRRQVGRHAGFGHGIHHCLGAALARLETRVALQSLLTAAPRFEVDLDHLQRRWSTNFRGYSSVPVSLA
jgi:cytochrome P450